MCNNLTLTKLYSREAKYASRNIFYGKVLGSVLAVFSLLSANIFAVQAQDFTTLQNELNSLNFDLQNLGLSPETNLESQIFESGTAPIAQTASVQTVNINGALCGEEKGKWVPGRIRSDGSFLSMSREISNNRKRLKKAKGKSKKRIERKIASMRKKIKNQKALCLTAPQVLAAQTQTPVSTATQSSQQTGAPALAPQSVTDGPITYTFKEAFYNTNTSELYVRFEATNNGDNPYFNLKQPTLIDNIGRRFRSNVYECACGIRFSGNQDIQDYLDKGTSRIVGFVFSITNPKPDFIAELLINSDPQLSLKNLSVTVPATVAGEPFTKTYDDVNYSIRYAKYDEFEKELIVAFNAKSNDEDRSGDFGRSFITDNLGRTVENSGYVDEKGTKYYNTQTISSPLAKGETIVRGYIFKVPSKPESISTFTINNINGVSNITELAYFNIPVPYEKF
jgi:hypothetical protein